MSTDFWLGLLVGVVLTVLVVSLVLPDRQAIWLAQRRNLPQALVVLALAGLIVVGFNILLALAFVAGDSLPRLRVETWVWILALLSLLVILVLGALRIAGVRIRRDHNEEGEVLL